MQEKVILEKLSDLPEIMKLEVLHYIEFLIMKNNKDKKLDLNESTKKRQFGCGKDIFTYVADDFDNELEMFKEYIK